MQIYPAIDLRGGQCVRLRQGDYDQETVFSSNPAEMARLWVDQGAQFLHLVDLDGAREGKPINGEAIQSIVRKAGVPCQLGGGLRTEEDLQQAFNWGVNRVVIGTRALRDPDWFKEICEKFPDKIVLGIDAKNGKVATSGWLEVSELSALELARTYEKLPLAALVYTDIARDGMLQGVNLNAMEEMARSVSLPVIASGGATSLKDIKQLLDRGLAGCIIGRALYEGTLKLPEVLRIAQTASE